MQRDTTSQPSGAAGPCEALDDPAPEHGSVLVESRPRGEASRVCRHCGLPLVQTRTAEPGFCCAGCARVFRLIHEQGLESYYTIKDNVTPPADGAVSAFRDYRWLQAVQRDAEQAGGAERAGAAASACLAVQGVSCAGCVWLIERVFRRQTGARECWVNAQQGSVRLVWTGGECDLADFARKLQGLGYLLGPMGEDELSRDGESRALIRRVGLCAAFAMNVMLFTLPTYFGMSPSFEYARLFSTLSLVFGTLSLLAGGGYFLGRAWRALVLRVPHIDLPISLGILVAYAGSVYGWITANERFIYFDFVAGFILLMLVGRWAQVAAVERNRRRLLRHQTKPGSVRLADGSLLPPESVRVGRRFLVPAGQSVPVDARLVEGDGVCSLASINGEAEPRGFRAGQRVPGGAVNVGRADLAVEALQDWPDSLLARLLQVSEHPAVGNPLLDRIVQGYLVAILLIAAAAGAGWWWATQDLLRTGAVVTAVLVVSCPCAVGLAFPLAEEMATVALRKAGVYVREGQLWNRLSRVRQIVFDKTGTLTFEHPQLKNPEELDRLGAEEQRALFTLVSDNPHPHAQAILERLLMKSDFVAGPGHVSETVGFGVEYAGWTLGRAGWREDGASGGGTIFAKDGRRLARFHLAQTARDHARREIAALQQRGYPVFVLSGDETANVKAFAESIGLAESHALGGLSPDAKAAWITAQGEKAVLMLGDGANDSLAFNRALCCGTPAVHRGVLENRSDFYYLGRGIGGIRALFVTNHIRQRTQAVILVFSVLYNLLAVGLAVAGMINPLVAAALMPINSLLTLAIVIWGMRPAFRALH